MTPDQAIQLAQFQRPGVKLVLGAEEAREEIIAPLSSWQLSQLPGDSSWQLRDLRLWLGFTPSLWAFACGTVFTAVSGRNPTKEEWIWLNGPASLKDTQDWVSAAQEKLKGEV